MAISYTRKAYEDDIVSPWPISGPNLSEDNDTLCDMADVVNGIDHTSRVIDVSGDGVPDIPDSAAGTTYVQNDWLTTDSWSGSTYSTLSVLGGVLKATVNSGQTVSYVSRAVTSATLRQVVARVKTSKAGTISLRGTVGGVADTIIASVSAQPGIWYNISGYQAGALTLVYLSQSGIVAGDTLEVDFIYIGTGEYTTTILSKSGANHLTNYGLLPVDGPHGKMLRGNGNGYAQADNPVIGTTGTICVYFKRSSLGLDGLLSNSNSVADGFLMYFTATNVLRFTFSNGTTHSSYGSNVYDSTTEYNSVVFNSAGQVFYDGVLSSDTIPASWVAGLRNLVIGNEPFYGGYFNGDLRFYYTSALLSDEEIYAWSQDPSRTPDSRQLSCVASPNTIITRCALGGFGNRIVTQNPKDATPANRPLGQVSEIVYYSGKLYFCTNATTPTWEAITSA